MTADGEEKYRCGSRWIADELPTRQRARSVPQASPFLGMFKGVVLRVGKVRVGVTCVDPPNVQVRHAAALSRRRSPLFALSIADVVLNESSLHTSRLYPGASVCSHSAGFSCLAVWV